MFEIWMLGNGMCEGQGIGFPLENGRLNNLQLLQKGQ